MAKPPASRLPGILSESAKHIIADWLAGLNAAHDFKDTSGGTRDTVRKHRHPTGTGLPRRQRQRHRCSLLRPATRGSGRPVKDPALQGFSPTETATFILSLKQPLFARMRGILAADAERLATETLTISDLVDALGLFMMESFQRAREEVIIRQQTEIAELSTPVVKLWQGILALPLIGTLDLARTQVVMENLLDSIVRYEADIAIIDITGVPTVDTLVAQHLLKTVAAARLMGADCIISGIRPQIAQTMVHLGVELNVISKANLSDAFALALRRLGKVVVSQRRPSPADMA